MAIASAPISIHELHPKLNLLSTVDDLFAFSPFVRHNGNGTIDPALVVQMTNDQLTPNQKVDGAFGDEFFTDRSWGYCVAVRHDGS